MDHAFQAILAAIASFFVVMILLAAAIILCQHYRKSSKAQAQPQPRTTQVRQGDASLSLSIATVDASWSSDPNLIKISWEELARATDNFSPHLIVGDGSFGLVYKARLSTGATVAVKKLSPDAFQGFREFTAEMETLSKLRHPNIVKILGYWASGPERLLVYEFVEKGNLDQWLHEPDVSRSPLPWPTRVNIIRGVAHGLSYLHALEKPVIHRDIKASNILLDSKFEAHIADFGLARRMDKTHSHVSTQFAGTIGYMPPEYRDGVNVANTKVDVYSFGVLMIETASSHRPNLPMKLGPDDIGMVQWARKMKERFAEMEMVDLNILRQGLNLKEESVKEYVRIACECTGELQKERPEMPQVLQWLDNIPL
ncbi:hypothetical protein VNO78_19645 [Psophocarpus tetragonolobus]|uniref:Protein kinase domain-containing protein n=1 Tax=Psophocarpus tetragonolobus TaxID=3891 RepID=A0AAN9SBT4_PSOTE